MSRLAITGLRKTFGAGGSGGEPPALDGVDLVVEEGELVVLVGPSGCGKSTLLRVVAGLETPDAGRVVLGGEDLTPLPPQRRDVAFVFQSYALYPHLTVRGNLEFPLRARGVPKAERPALVADVARRLDIEALLERKPGELSGGQRQRVAMGRAMIRRPRLFLFDEPLSNLDARLRAAMRLELVELHRALGTTSVHVTHDQAEAMTLGQRIAVMRAGRIEQIGPPREVYDRPATPFVATFLGSPPMALLEGEIVRASGASTFRFAGGEVEVPTSLDPGPVTLGVRPEAWRLAAGASGSGGLGEQGGLAATVRVVEDLGAECHALVDLAGTPVTVRLDPGLPSPRAGETVALEVVGSTHWFRGNRRVGP